MITLILTRKLNEDHSYHIITTHFIIFIIIIISIIIIIICPYGQASEGS